MKTAVKNVSNRSSTKAASDSGAPDLLKLKGLSPTTANQTAFFFRSLVRFGLLAVTVSAADSLDAWAFSCLLVSMNFFRFSGNPLFFAALLRALVNDFAERGVRIVKPYFFLYSFAFISWVAK